LALAIVVAAALLAVLVAASPAPALTTAVGMSGLAGMGLQVALIIAFQAAHGSIHQWLSFIFAAFLAGTAAGAVWSKRTQRPHQAVVLGMDILLACCGLLLPLLLPYAVSWPHSASGTFTVGALFFPLANAVAGFAVGAQFPAALALFSRHGTAESSAFNFCYALDLAGACLGAFAVGAIAVPAFGLLHTCAALGGAKAATAFWLALEHKTQHQAPRVRTNGSFWTKAAVTVVFVVCIGVVQLEAPNRMLYSFSFNRFYHLLLVGLLGWGIARAISYVRAEEQGKGNGLLVRLDRKTAKAAGLSFFRLVNYCGFALAVFYPLGRCYFSLPYLFCHVCPRKCVFGFLRPYLVPAALIMNLERRHWCFHACPIGTVHDCQ
ncbi:MAG TPA: hypothetical protein PLP17_16480, partial [Oligoflexia bacterium]|nr:hypothetical protein [Oligoflexia bacterium]